MKLSVKHGFVAAGCSALIAITTGGVVAQSSTPGGGSTEYKIPADSAATAGIGARLTYQGRLTNANNTPVTTPVNMTFRLYDDAGTAIYTATRTLTPINGLFTVGANAPYTYPDLNSAFLAWAVYDPNTQQYTVQTPSYWRGQHTGFGPLYTNPTTASPNWLSNDPRMKYRTLRPRPADQLLPGDPNINQLLANRQIFPLPATAQGDVRNLPGLKKKPSTSELLDWLKLLVAEDIPLEALQSKDEKVSVPPLVGALLKNEQDVTLVEKLVFMQRHNR